MPEERGYTRQVRTAPGAPLPSVSADSFGAGVGGAIGQAGQMLHSEKLEDARIDRTLRDNSEWSAFQTNFAAAREEISAAAREGRKSDDPGHAERIAEEIEKKQSALLERVTSERLKQRASATIADWGSGFRTREADWEVARQGVLTVERFRDQRGVAEGRTRRLEDPDDYASELKIQMDAIGGLDVPDEMKTGLIEETEQLLAVSYLRGMIDRDPQAAKALLDSPSFDGVLTGNQVEALLNSSDVEIRRMEAEAEREQAELLAGVREKLQVFEQAERAGLVQDPEEYDAAIASAQSLGDDSLALKLELAKSNSTFTKIWGPENANALQRERRLTELAGMDKRSDGENLELAFLRKHSSSWAAKEASDPVGQAAARGGAGAPPPMDMEDPASIMNRGLWAQSRSEGGPPAPAFTKVEAQQLSQLYDSGRAGEERVMDILNALPPAQAMASARLIDPDNRTLPITATLDPLTRNIARRGREALKADRNLISGAIADNPDLEEGVIEARRGFNRALVNIPPDQRDAIKETAEEILAGYTDKTGAEITIVAYELAIDRALGAVGVGDSKRGGLARWGEQSFVLPGGVTSRGFRSAVLKSASESKDPPSNPDGSPANLARAYPVAVGPGLYEFHTGSGNAIRRKSGKLYRVEVGPQ